MTLRDVDAALGRLGRSRAARMLGWLLVAAWCVYVLVRITG